MKQDSKTTVNIFEKWHSHKLMKKYLLVKLFYFPTFPLFSTVYGTH